MFGGLRLRYGAVPCHFIRNNYERRLATPALTPASGPSLPLLCCKELISWHTFGYQARSATRIILADGPSDGRSQPWGPIVSHQM